MSTLNTFGFNVRRKRQQDAPTFSNLKPGKSIPSMERSLAFTATPISSTPTNTRLRTTQLGKPRRSKDPKQSTLLPFFTTTSTTTQQVAKGNDNNISDGQDEGTQVCVVRRHITIVDLMPILMETFQGYNNTIDRPLSLKGQHNSVMDLDTTQRRRRRRRRNDDDDDDDDQAVDTLHTTFATSMSLTPLTKRSCPLHLSHALTTTIDPPSSDDDVEIKTVRHCLSTQQVNALLLDIANEVFAYGNNSWCASYLDQ